MTKTIETSLKGVLKLYAQSYRSAETDAERNKEDIRANSLINDLAPNKNIAYFCRVFYNARKVKGK